MTQTSFFKHVGHGGLGRRGVQVNSIAKKKKWEKDRDLHNLSIYAPGFRRRGYAEEKIDVL
jgi:hypothetical protein